MQKRGQFYLIGAVAVIGLLIGFAAIYNSATRSEKSATYQLREEINFEVSQVLDNSVRQNVADSETKNNIKILTDYYAQKNPDSQFFTVFSTESEIHISRYGNDSAKLFYESAEIQFTEEGFSETTLSRTSNEITFQIAEIYQTIQLKKGKNFFIIIVEENENGRIVAF